MMGGLKWDHRLSLLTVFVWITAAYGEDILSYNSSTKQIHFRCPATINGNVMFMQLLRFGNPDVALANWTKERAYTEEERIKILPARKPYLLEAVMDHVTCADSAIYSCHVMADNDQKGVFMEQQQQIFQYEGEVTDPVPKRKPFKNRYRNGDKITLECSARLGNENNTFVWESRLPNKDFAAVKDDEDPCTNVKVVRRKTGTCEIEAVTMLEWQLSAEDDGREWRCRLQQSQHEALFTVAVDCFQKGGCLVPCRTETGESLRLHETTDSSFPGGSLDSPRAAPLTEGEKNDETTKVVLITVLPVCFTIAVIASVAMLRRRREKQLPPILVMDSPPETEYGYSTTSTACTLSSPSSSRSLRRLPEPPIDFMFDNRDSHTTYTTANDDDDDTPPKMMSHYSMSRPSSSVYVSMSAINFPETPAGERVGLVAGDGTGPSADGVGQGPRFERSTSVYSNSAAIAAEAARSRANSADGGAVRAHATYKKELM